MRIGWHKWVEWALKLALAFVAALLFFRPGRRRHARHALRQAQDRPLAAKNLKTALLVRIDNRVGEALLTTPLCDALRSQGYRVTALVHPKVVRVLEGHSGVDELLPFEGWPKVWALRARRFEVVVNCASWAEPSVTASLVSRVVAGHGVLLGPRVFPSGWLCDVVVEPMSRPSSLDSARDERGEARDERNQTLQLEPSERIQRTHLLSPLFAPPYGPLSFRSIRSNPELLRWVSQLNTFAVLNPGGRLAFRTLAPEVFSEAARILSQRGITPVITWGPSEEALALSVASQVPGALVAPPTDLDGLALLMKSARVTVCNNTGPMHLSVAVGTPTFGLFLKMDCERWGHHEAPHQMLDFTPVAAERHAEYLRAPFATWLDGTKTRQLA